MAGIVSVEVVERWVFGDLASSEFDDEDQNRVLEDLDELQKHLAVWNRQLTKCVEILSDTGDETIYRRREGGLRSFFVRRGDTLYCIGVGKRRTAYERDLTQIVARAEEHDPNIQ